MRKPVMPTALASRFALATTSGELWAGLGGATSHTQQAAQRSRPDHVVVAVFENHAYIQVIGSFSAPYISSLRTGGANLTASYAESHPSQPNYFALFFGAITDDSCYTVPMD
jgi:hypothetical protein